MGTFMVETANTIWRDYVTDGVPSSTKNKPKKSEIRTWGTWIEGIITAFTANGGLIYSSKAALDPDLAHAANTMAWVLGDATVANNGVYQKQGASGAGSWTRVADLPFSFIIASDAGAGTANAIQATTSIPVSGSALIWMNIFEANTASPVTVSFNGGSALTIKTNSGNDVEVGGLTAGMIVLGIVSGTNFRLVSDQASAAVLAACEAARDEAVAAASSVQSEQASRAHAIANYHPISAPDFIRVAGYAASGDGGAALYKKVGAEPTHAGKMSITLDDAVTVVWYEIADAILRPPMLGMVGDWNGTTGTDNAVPFSNLLATHAALKCKIRFDNGETYMCASQVLSDADHIDIDGDFSSTIYFSTTSGSMLGVGVGRAEYDSKALAQSVTIGTKVLEVADTTGLQAGDLVQLRSNKAWYNDPRADPTITAGAFDFTQAGGTTTTAVLAASFSVADPASMVGKSITFLSGAMYGYARRITAYNDATKTITFTPALPSAVGSGIRYVFPECRKGQTSRVGRVIDGLTFEIVDVLSDGYHVTDGDATLITEEVTIAFYRPYSPRVRGLRIEGPASVTSNIGLAVHHGCDVDIDVRTLNCRSAGGNYARLHRGRVNVNTQGASRVETGYGVQLSECAQILVGGTGWNNRRVCDLSGNFPADSNTLEGGSVDGGGLQADGSAYYPVGAVETFGVGTHGAGRNTIYQDWRFEGVMYGIYERGRGAIVRDCEFGAGVKYPVVHSFGGRIELYDNVVDARVFSNFETTSEVKDVGNYNGKTAKDAYAECLLVLGATLLADSPSSTIIVRDNFVRAKKNIVQMQKTGAAASTLTNLNVFDNDVEFFPLLTTDVVGAYGKMAGSSSGAVVLAGGRHGVNRMRTAAANTQPVVCGAEISLTTNVGVTTEFGNGRWTVRMANDTAVWFPVPQNLRNKILVAISVEEEDVSYFSGWINKNSASVRLIAGAAYEVLATAPTGSSGSTGVFQLHYGDGKLTLGNRLGFTRTFNVEFFSMG